MPAGPRVEHLTHREEEVLRAIGHRLTNPEIADQFFISVRTVESHVSSLLRKLGAGSRTDLIAAAATLQRSRIVEVPNNSFVGRDAELARVRALLDDYRLVTVTGPPGSGKTRLALEVLAAHPFSPIVADLERDRQLLPAIARVMGLASDREADLGSLCGVALDSGDHVVLLDNCDLIEDARVWIPLLLAMAPDLKMLVTSRSPLGMSDEVIFRLEPLDLEAGAKSAAVALFLDRVRAASPARAVRDSDTDRAVRICRRLDGLPLAIELAAARARHMSLSELEASMPVFRQVGDLRCLIRSYVQMADLGVDETDSLRNGLVIAVMANDRRRQRKIGERMVVDLWQSGRRREAALLNGALLPVEDLDDTGRLLEELGSAEWKTVLLEGRAAGLKAVLEMLR